MKRDDAVAEALRKRRSQPTYEGLKLEALRKIDERSQGSQPTYEGLKHRLGWVCWVRVYLFPAYL